MAFCHPTSKRNFATYCIIAATSVAIGIPAISEASQPNPISGTADSHYYQSSQLRHVTTANDSIIVNLSTRTGALDWWIVEPAHPGYNENDTVINVTNQNVVIVSHVTSGTTFYNAYMADKSGTTVTFKGQETY